MKKTILLSAILVLFVSCGDNTTTVNKNEIKEPTKTISQEKKSFKVLDPKESFGDESQLK